ncbi:DUF1249 domain-containing protein [Aurantivibrio plasticivorans]
MRSAAESAAKAIYTQRDTSAQAGMSRRVKKSRYKVDLADHHATCEFNYASLKRLLAALDAKDSCQFEVGQSTLLSVDITDRAPYTTTVTLGHQLLHEASSDVAKLTNASVEMTVRMYHDAEMAEVVAWNRHYQWQARYETPNEKMYHPDEKQQQNKFLRDWLTLCQSQGRVTVDLKTLGLK